MSKTITVSLDDHTYELFKKAAEGQRRTISNYIVFATLNYTVGQSLVDDKEMREILQSEAEIQKGLDDIASGRYRVID